MAAPRWTDADTAALQAGHAAGKSLHAIAKELGRGKATVSRKANALGLKWDREQVQAATAAKTMDAKARRAALQLALLDDAERLREQLWAPCIVFNFGGKDNTYEQRELDKPTFTDQLKIMQATGVAIDRSLKLADHDSTGAEQVRSLLVGLADALGLTPEPQDQPVDA